MVRALDRVILRNITFYITVRRFVSIDSIISSVSSLDAFIDL